MKDLKALKEQVSSYSILVVDDEEEIRNSTGRLCKNFFGEVVVAVDGQDALEKYKQKGHFDMVLTDVNMPRMNGTALAKELRSIDEKVFLVIMSGDYVDHQQDIQKNDMTIHKPIGIDTFIEVVSALIESKDSN